MIRILIVLILMVFSSSAIAGDTKSLNLTIYNQGRALVTEVRSMEFGQGRSRVEFMGVPETIEPESLQVVSLTAPGDLGILDMNYEYDLVSVQNLLNRYVGRKLTVVLPDSKDATAKAAREATLIANNDLPVFDLGDRIYVGPYESVLLPAIPEGLRPRPALVWLVNNNGPKIQDVQVSYLAGAVSWRADYVLKLDRDEKKASLSSWITLDNRSGMAFEDANLKLVAGEVHRAGPRGLEPRVSYAMKAKAATDVLEEGFFEYHLYSVTRPVSVANRQTKQIRLFDAPEVAVGKELVSEHGGYWGRGQPTSDQPVNVYLLFKNSEQSGLGLPLPKGVLRAYQESMDGSTILIGEDNIEHTPEEAEIRLNMGQAFDVKVERTLTEFDEIGKNRLRYVWKIDVRNSKDEPVDLKLRENMPGDWKIISSSHDYVQESAFYMRYDLTVPPLKASGPLTVTYKVEVEY